MSKDNYSKECSFDVLLPYINSGAEKSRARLINKNIKSSFYPLTKKTLVDYYLNTNYSNLKNSFSSVNCAADVYSYFVQSYGFKPGSNDGTQNASGAQSSGLNPFFGINANLGFNFGSLGSYFWILLLGYGVYKLSEKK